MLVLVVPCSCPLGKPLPRISLELECCQVHLQRAPEDLRGSLPSIMKEKVQLFCIDDLTGVDDMMMVGDTGVALVDGGLVAYTVLCGNACAPCFFPKSQSPFLTRQAPKKLGTLWDTPPKPRPVEVEGIQASPFVGPTRVVISSERFAFFTTLEVHVHIFVCSHGASHIYYTSVSHV